MNLFACSITSGVSFSGGNTPQFRMLNPDSREYEYQGYSRQNDDRQYFLFPFHIYLMYASVKNYNIQKYEKAGDDEGDLLPFLE